MVKGYQHLSITAGKGLRFIIRKTTSLENLLNNKFSRFIFIILVFSLALSACTTGAQANGKNQPAPTATFTPFTMPAKLWIDPAIPAALSGKLMAQSAIQTVDNRDEASLFFEPNASIKMDILQDGAITWVYALEAPFPTVTDQISASQLIHFWKGEDVGDLPFTMIEVSQETMAVFEKLWGSATEGRVSVVDETQLATNDFTQMQTWAIVPFDQVAPRWKVIKVDGISPLDKPMDVDNYALTVYFSMSMEKDDPSLKNDGLMLLGRLPVTNRDEAKMTVLMMTGTTAMVRTTAYKMELNGVDYPIKAIKDWFKNADLIHVSNEISFNPDCPYPDPFQAGLQFCSNPKYIQTLQDLGVNVVELTGNHVNDYGPEYFVDTINTYEGLGWNYYGGGINDEMARQPIKLESNGNKIAFIGCNTEGPTQAWALPDRAGAAKCDMTYFTDQIKALKLEGYVVIATFQTAEVYTNYTYQGYVAEDFDKSALAGADIVSGSQSHTPMSFHFVNNSLEHYGLGNFLFDNMTYAVIGEKIRREFIDRHIIYDGKYINTELLTAILVDWSQPNPMTDEERNDFLTDMLGHGDWK
jgi:poly-gamma-glutamate synthesis protein (capsule biosynthesis protein)